MFGDDERTVTTKRDSLPGKKRPSTKQMILISDNQEPLSPKFTGADPSDVKIDVYTTPSSAF